jgi:hypothetical protein
MTFDRALVCSEHINNTANKTLTTTADLYLVYHNNTSHVTRRHASDRSSVVGTNLNSKNIIRYKTDAQGWLENIPEEQILTPYMQISQLYLQILATNLQNNYKYYVLDIIHSHVFIWKHRSLYFSRYNVSETGFCLRLQVKRTHDGVIRWRQDDG